MADDPNVFLGMTISNRDRIQELVGRGYFSFVFKAFDQQDQVRWLHRLSIFRDVVSGLHQMHISQVAHQATQG